MLLAIGAGIAAVPRGAIGARLAGGAIAGLITGGLVAALAALIALVPLRSIFIALSPDLLAMLTAGLGLAERRRAAARRGTDPGIPRRGSADQPDRPSAAR